MKIWLASLFISQLASAAPRPEVELVFPPVERILGTLRAPSATAERLRDSLGSSPDVPWLVRELRAKDPARRRSAVEALGEPGRVEAIPWIAAVLLRVNEDKDARVAAAVALGRIGEPRIRKYLGEALKDPVVEVRFAAMLALGQADPPGATVMLERSLREDPDWWGRYAAALALGKTAQPYAVSALEGALKSEKIWQVRLQAVRSLQDIGTGRAAAAVGEALGDPDSGVRAAAAMALGEIGIPENLPALKRALDQADDSYERSLIARAFQRAVSRP